MPLPQPHMRVYDDTNTNSTAICNGNTNTYIFGFENQTTLSGLSIFSNYDVQENETLSLMCNDQKNDTKLIEVIFGNCYTCLLYTSPSPRDGLLSRMPSSA